MKTCDEIREALPLELPGPGSPAVREHLDVCPACQADWLDLQALRNWLDAVPEPPAPVIDLASIYAASHDRYVRSSRRWRRIAGTAAALAAGILLVAVLPRLEVRLGGHELVLRWGTADPPPPAAPDAVLHARLDQLDDRLAARNTDDERLNELKDLLLTLAADVDDRDRRQQHELDNTIRQIALLDAATREQFRRTSETSAALYTLIQEKSRLEGDQP
jgi:hypothetical protein